MYIVGTAYRMVTRCRAAAARKSAGTNRSCRTSVPPAATRAFMMKFWPKQWNSGSAHSPRSSAVMRRWCTVA